MIFPGPWIPDTLPQLYQDIARRALSHVGVCEDPPGSNTGPVVDRYLKRIGVPTGYPWCAANVAEHFDACGAATPPGASASSCDAWLKWAKEHNLFTPNPGIGHAVLYGVPGDANHVGIVVMLSPKLLAVEGNTSLDNTPNREGVAVDLRAVNVARVLGYVRPAAK